MHYYTASRYWVVLPALIASASAGAVSVARPTYLDSDSSSSPALDAAIQSLRIDSNSAQASFSVPCSNCIGGALNQSFLFDLEAFASSGPCAFNNVSLNGVPLTQDWESIGVHGQGLASLRSSGHELNVFLTSDCLHGEHQDDHTGASQLLTVTIEQIDREDIRSLSGFTLSFKQHPKPELLRLAFYPDYDARVLPYSETWRDPPEDVPGRLYIDTVLETPKSEDGRLLSLEEQLNDLKQLEDQATELIKLIEAKKSFINSQFPESANDLKQKVKACESFLCVIKAIGRHVHKVAHAAYLKLHNSNQAYTKWQSTAGGQAPTMLSSSDMVVAPEDCHCHDSKPKARPPPYRGTIANVGATSVDEKKSYNSTQPDDSQWREATNPSLIIVVLKFLFVITGLAFILRLLRLCFMSDRRRVERAAERERRATERMYKCAARKQSWRDWWHGRRRGSPGYKHGDYEEKRALILQQEGILEGHMQDEIQQLQIQEEIRQLRYTRDAVNDLIRAEEGRSVPPMYSSSSSHPYGFHPLPAPITIPSAASGLYPVHGHAEEYDDDHPGTPLSRTSSLPDYKTEASSEPPGYESDRRSSSGYHDGYSEYAHSIHTSDSIWSPGSSIPDISPRPSIETARTFL